MEEQGRETQSEGKHKKKSRIGGATGTGERAGTQYDGEKSNQNVLYVLGQ